MLIRYLFQDRADYQEHGRDLGPHQGPPCSLALARGLGYRCYRGPAARHPGHRVQRRWSPRGQDRSSLLHPGQRGYWCPPGQRRLCDPRAGHCSVGGCSREDHGRPGRVRGSAVSDRHQGRRVAHWPRPACPREVAPVDDGWQLRTGTLAVPLGFFYTLIQPEWRGSLFILVAGAVPVEHHRQQYKEATMLYITAPLLSMCVSCCFHVPLWGSLFHVPPSPTQSCLVAIIRSKPRP